MEGECSILCSRVVPTVQGFLLYRFPDVGFPDGGAGFFCLCIFIAQSEPEKRNYLPLGCVSEVISSLPKQIQLLLG